MHIELMAFQQAFLNTPHSYENVRPTDLRHQCLANQHTSEWNEAVMRASKASYLFCKTPIKNITPHVVCKIGNALFRDYMTTHHPFITHEQPNWCTARL